MVYPYEISPPHGNSGIYMGLSYWMRLGTLVTIAAGLGYYAGRYSVTETPTAQATKKILYYRNPMGLADTSPTPKKDAMGMDYLPVYEQATENTPQTGTVTLNNQTIQKLGVQTQRVAQREFAQTINALGSIVIAESHVYDVAPRFEAWAIKLYVNAIGQRINRGEILFDAKIPNLYAAEVAYRLATQKIVDSVKASAEIKKAAELALVKSMTALDDIGVGAEELQRLQHGGEPYNQIPYRSPINGIVIAKNIVEGGYIEPGKTLYQLADLSQLWLEIQLPEPALAHVTPGDRLVIKTLTDPEHPIDSTIDYIYPTLDPENRGAKLRAVLENNDYRLKPGQTAQVMVFAKSRKTLAIPRDALIDSGLKQWVLVALAHGAFQPKEITVGERDNEWIEIRSGLKEGENVVHHATFLIDSESRLQAALAGFADARFTSKAEPPAEAETHSAAPTTGK
jgi:membrane fusion protein, copper/silver efflux system